MDSTCFQPYSSDLKLGDSLPHDMIEHIINKDNFINRNIITTDFQSSDELLFKNNLKAKNSEPEIPKTISSCLDSFDNTLFDTITNSKLITSSKIQYLCNQIVQDMNYLGICRIDHFMEDFGELIWLEVMNLYNTIVFTEGMLLNTDHNKSANICNTDNKEVRDIRGDLIYWVTGNEPNCRHIRILMKTLDTIIFECNRMNNNGLMGLNRIQNRTPAMVACYPGNGTGYMKHADNSNGDGRCITCIYYINKDWNSSRDGGLLRVYPKLMKSECPFIEIEPIFDRLVFFWSDRRNLHEVLPSKRLRFAITVWYFDDEERQRYRKRF